MDLLSEMISLVKRTTGFIILLLTLFSCGWITDISPSAKPSSNGFLSGMISIGPLCPVEQYPPDSACLPTMDTYRAWATAVYSPDKKKKLFTIIPNIKGIFLDSLPAGNYIIDYDTLRGLVIGSSNLPIPFKIMKGDTTNVSINIDTGIR